MRMEFGNNPTELTPLQEASLRNASRLYDAFIKAVQPPDNKPDLKLVHSAPVDEAPPKDPA
jgi:hypothetical protein